MNGLISIALTKSSHRSINTNDDAIRGVVLVKSKTELKLVKIKFIGRTANRVLKNRSPGRYHIAEVEPF